MQAFKEHVLMIGCPLLRLAVRNCSVGDLLTLLVVCQRHPQDRETNVVI